MMSGIRGKDTKPELVIRKALHAAGFRFRLHAKDVPGKPDIVLPRYRAAIFINGCFWHRHDCHLFRMPSTRTEFWQQKIESNVQRDIRTHESLAQTDWRQLTIWECALKGRTHLDFAALMNTVVDWLRSDEPFLEVGGHA
jgi:DNA mismatch endonuclease (patch repair protein)